MAARAAILDIDGTLVDTNYQHALAWFRAFRDHDLALPLFRIHRHMGMGGDQLVAALAGEEFDRRCGDQVREVEKQHYAKMVGEVEVMDGARELIERLREWDLAVVLASSARPEEVEHYIEQLGVAEAIEAWTSSEDVEETKPKPDLIQSAQAKVSAEKAVMLGDSTWDCKASKRAGVPAVAVLTGGFAEAELREAGAVLVIETLEELIDGLEQTPFGELAGR